MENNTTIFKTNLNCSNCVSKIQKDFDEESRIVEWQVDTNHPDKLLRVVYHSITEEDIMKLVQKKGFEIFKN